jgi:hypothetical protein
LTPGGSSTYLHTNNTQDTENGTNITIKKLGTSITMKKLEDNIKIETEWKGWEWIDLAKGGVQGWALVNTVPNTRVPYNARSCDWRLKSQLLKVGSNPRS